MLADGRGVIARLIVKEIVYDNVKKMSRNGLLCQTDSQIQRTTWGQTDFPFSLTALLLQVKEINPLASAAAGEGGIQIIHADGRIPGEGSARSHPHPASPRRHGPTTAPGLCFVLSACLVSWCYLFFLSFYFESLSWFCGGLKPRKGKLKRQPFSYYFSLLLKLLPPDKYALLAWFYMSYYTNLIYWTT